MGAMAERVMCGSRQVFRDKNPHFAPTDPHGNSLGMSAKGIIPWEAQAPHSPV